MNRVISQGNLDTLCAWREQCRTHLMRLEKKSISVRTQLFTKIVNEKTLEVKKLLCFYDNSGSVWITPFEHHTECDVQCKFIETWRGLNVNQIRSLPTTYREYETRAKNWLNGRRAINYGQTLFPDLIMSAQEYAHTVSCKVITDNNNKCRKQEVLRDVLIYAYLAAACSGRVALYDGHHRASLICENSIKKEGNLKRMMQHFYNADDDNDADADDDDDCCDSVAEQRRLLFPLHLQDAVDYFKRKFHEKVNEYQSMQQQQQQQQPQLQGPPPPHIPLPLPPLPLPLPLPPLHAPVAHCYKPYHAPSTTRMLSTLQRDNCVLQQQISYLKQQQRADQNTIQNLRYKLSLLTPPATPDDCSACGYQCQPQYQYQ